jgi:hypothetical protein
MENKTSVEKVIDQFKDWLNHELGHDPTAIMLLEQIENGALAEYVELVKLQIMQAFIKGYREGDAFIVNNPYNSALEYYSETYKKPTE